MDEKMRFYEVDVVAYAQIGARTFTYAHQSTSPLKIGQIVKITFGRQKSLGVIKSQSKPSPQLRQKIKAIDEIIADIILPAHLVRLADWLKTYYATSSHAVWSTILPSGLTAKRRDRPKPNNDCSSFVAPHNILSSDQQYAFDTIMNTTIPVLLDGVTGSGKTHIYQELITHYLRNDLSVLYLSAEIFLTQQLEKRLANYFQNHIILSHSKLTAVQRRNIWLDCLHETTAKLYLGPRSNLFLPFHKLGLIIIDESHDTSYKQENAPRYHARDVGAKLAQLSNAKLVLGSATHDITTIRLAQLGRLKTVNLHHRHKNQKLPNVSVIDIKGVHRPLSPELLKAMRLRLELGQQSLLLHNRRGSARRLSCEDCGNTLLCPRCDGGLVFHADEGRLRCHICNYNQFPPSICPVCRSHNLHYHGFGTKQLVSEVQKHFPEAKIARIDRDEALKNSFSNTLVAIEKGEIDILIGTQMVAKGLDFPFLTLVGIVAGDELLFGDDFQSRERGMSLILQASGRAGRAEKIGEVLIQTYQPDNPNWRNILSHDWANFYSEELVRRKKFGYPPYQFLSRINFFASSADKAQARAEEWLRDTSMPDGIKMLGPAIPNHPRTPRGYCAHVICKASRRSLLTQLASLLPRDTSYDIDPISLF